MCSSNRLRSCSPITFFKACLQLLSSTSAHLFWWGAAGAVNNQLMLLSVQQSWSLSESKPLTILHDFHCAPTICNPLTLNSTARYPRMEHNLLSTWINSIGDMSTANSKSGWRWRHSAFLSCCALSSHYMGESNHTRSSRTEVFAVPSREPTGLPLTVSLPCVSFLDKKHLNFTALRSLFAFRIQYFCSPCCYSRMAMVLHIACNQQGYPVLIGKQHWVFAFVGHDCFVNHSSR